MNILVTIYTTGKSCDFSFSVEWERDDYKEATELSQEEIDKIDDALEESFWEAMNGDSPEGEITFQIENSADFEKVKLMSYDELVNYVSDFVKSILVSSEMAYAVDGVDVSHMFDTKRGKWDELIFEYITSAVLDELITDLKKEKS